MCPDVCEALFERCLGVDAMQVVELHPDPAPTAQALFDLGPQDLRLTPPRAAQSAFGGDQANTGLSRCRHTDRLLALASGVEMRGVDHLHARLNRGFEEVDV